MAPNEGRRDPNLIDVSLSLWPGQSEQAMSSLAAAISTLNKHLLSADLPNTVANLEGASSVIQDFRRQTEIYEGGRSPAAARTSGGVGTVSQPDAARGQGASRGGPQEVVQTTTEGTQRQGSPTGAGDSVVQPHERKRRERLGQFARRWEATQGASWRAQKAAEPGDRPYEGRGAELADLALDMFRPAGAGPPPSGDGGASMGLDDRPGGGGGGGGGRSSGASVGGGGEQPYDPRLNWIRHSRLETLDQPMQVPRFGEWTMQDKIRMAADYLARQQLQRNDRAEAAGQDLPGQWLGRASGALSVAANNYAVFNAFGQHVRQGLANVGLSREGEQAMAGMGYSQQGGNIGANIFGTEIGGELPIIGPMFSQAGRANMRREFEIRRMSLSPQISGQQSREIFDTINQQGYSGGEADNLAYRLYEPLVRQGASAGVVGQATDEAYRYGNASVDALRESLQDLGGAARNTRQSVDQVVEGLTQFSQTAAEHGATLGRGLQTGREFMEATGQRPEVATRALENPLFQSIAMQRTGLLPSQLGTMTGTEIADTQGQVVKMAMQMTRGFNRPRTETVIDAHGRTITRHISGQEARIAQAAHVAGMDVETFKQTQRHQTRQQRYSAATTAVEAWADDVRHAHAGKAGDIDFHHPGRGLEGDAQALQSGRGGRNRLNWNQVAKELADAGVSRDRIREISGHNFQDRAKMARGELEKRSDKERTGKHQVVDIRLTGLAEKLFQAKLGGGNKYGHSDTSAFKTAAGVGIDVARFGMHPSIGGAKNIVGDIGDLF